MKSIFLFVNIWQTECLFIVFDLLFRIWHMKWYSNVIQYVFTYISTSSMLSSKNIMFRNYSMFYLYTHDDSYAYRIMHICSLSCYIA